MEKLVTITKGGRHVLPVVVSGESLKCMCISSQKKINFPRMSREKHQIKIGTESSYVVKKMGTLGASKIPAVRFKGIKIGWA